ncbi:MAG TPA: carbamoyltransferase C-terminal domain-containing protein [Bryobacteraceae bacterium]|jgi:carbamoyltransferase|nr:carbamoyltransferase C-terminal domain-containing protein [Bryobacteraceae bacterium]
MIILGIGGILGDAACAILSDGCLAAAIEESKLSRQGLKPGPHGPTELPEQSMAACLSLAGVAPEKVDAVVLVRPLALRPEATLHLQLRARFPNSRIMVLEHHTAHAASAYYPSPFEDATVLTLDRAGDFRCGTRWRATGTQLTLERELYYPDSLGDLYGRVTELLGFHANLEEHKVQWLSAAGDGRFRDLFLEIMPMRDGEWPRLDRFFFDAERLTGGGFSARFYERLGVAAGAAVPEPLRAPLAAGLQHAVEETVIRMAGVGAHLCFAGGLGLNALLVSALECAPFESVFVQPAAGNAGTAIGAVLHTWHTVYNQPQRIPLDHLYLGPSYTAEEIKRVLENCKLRFRYIPTTEETIETAIRELAENRIVAWMHGRMEFGPRALGNRSILASPLDPYAAENLNTFIKHREPFRKFAASVPAELAGEYFECGPNARFLATTGRVRPAHRGRFASAVLNGDLVRVHTVAQEDNPLYWTLLHAAGKTTGLPVLYNTSFNLFSEPLVCNPRDAVRSFYSSGIDAMFVGNFFLQK